VGARPLKSRVMSYGGSCPTNVVISYQTSRRQPVAIFQDGGLRRATNPHVGSGKSQNSKFTGGFCPPFWWGSTHSPSKVRFCLTMLYRGLLPPNFGGAQILHPPFLNFGPGGNALKLAQVSHLLLVSTNV
jgi:hypothetical protein